MLTCRRIYRNGEISGKLGYGQVIRSVEAPAGILKAVVIEKSNSKLDLAWDIPYFMKVTIKSHYLTQSSNQNFPFTPRRSPITLLLDERLRRNKSADPTRFPS